MCGVLLLCRARRVRPASLRLLRSVALLACLAGGQLHNYLCYPDACSFDLALVVRSLLQPRRPFPLNLSHVVAMAALSSLRGGLLFAVYAVCMLLVLVRADTEADTSSARPRSDYDFVWWFPFS